MIVPADAVIQRRQVLFISTRCKGLVGGHRIDEVESYEQKRKEDESNKVTRSVREVYGMTSGLVKWDDRSRNDRGEDGILDQKGNREDGTEKLTLNSEGIGSKRD